MNFKEWLLLSENATIAQSLKQSNDPSIKQIKSIVTTIVNDFAKNIPEKIKSTFINYYTWNFYISKETDFESFIRNTKDYLMANYPKLISRLNDTTFEPEELTYRANQAADGETILKLDHLGPQWKGWKWVSLNKGFCGREAQAMGHCGGIDSVDSGKGDNILSLRTASNVPHLTFIENDGILGEMKGRGNAKPDPKYHQPIIELLKLKRIKSVKGDNKYKPEDNFSLDDLSNKEELLKLKPELDYKNYYSKTDVNILSDDDIYSMLSNSAHANTENETAELIIKNKSNLSENNVENLLHYCRDKDKIAELIINKIPNLSDNNVYNLLKVEYAKEKDEIAKLIIKKKPELSNDNVLRLLQNAINKNTIAGLIGRDNINKLTDDNVSTLLYGGGSTIQHEIAIILGEKRISELPNRDFVFLLSNSQNIEEMAILLGKDNINKLSNDEVQSMIVKMHGGYKRKDEIRRVMEKYRKFKK